MTASVPEGDSFNPRKRAADPPTLLFPPFPQRCVHLSKPTCAKPTKYGFWGHVHTQWRTYACRCSTSNVRSLENPLPNLVTLAAYPNHSPVAGLVMETVYPGPALHPCGFPRLIHSSTHNDYYDYLSLVFHCVS
jgi:hypothetical protein